VADGKRSAAAADRAGARAAMPDAERAAQREAARLDGNRIWRVETPRGPVLQKLYAERGSWLHAWGRELGTRLRGGKTSTRASGRRATERRLLALWRAHGCDVPAELSAEHPELANARTLVLELIEGPLLSRLLDDPVLPATRRAQLIARFAADLARRHDLALAHGEAGLVHEHGGIAHVLVAAPLRTPAPGPPDGAPAGPPVGMPAADAIATAPVAALRFVSFDLENSFRPRRDLAPLIAKEVASCLRSLARGRQHAAEDARADALGGVRAGVRAFVAGYGARERLAAAAAHYLDHPSPLWRLVWSVDRRREERRGRPGGKYAALLLLREELGDAGRAGARR
jgi:hypothetical protein